MAIAYSKARLHTTRRILSLIHEDGVVKVNNMVSAGGGNIKVVVRVRPFNARGIYHYIMIDLHELTSCRTGEKCTMRRPDQRWPNRPYTTESI